MAETLNKLVAIVTVPLEEVRESGIITPVSKNTLYKKGVIDLVAADSAQPIKIGDTVLYFKHGIQSADVKIGDRVYDLVSEGGIMVKL